jgi:Fe-S-cluster-containing hydrogenase component 2
MLYVDETRCSGCGACVEVCTTGAISLGDGKAVINQEQCSQCEACFDACPERAILSVSARSLVPERDRPAVVATSPSGQVRSISAGAAPALAAALIYVGREVVPRVANLLLDALERRMTDFPRSGVDQIATGSDAAGRSGSGQRRRRRHRGAK